LRDAADSRPDVIRDFVLVTHGVTLRCFRMQWMHYPWEWFEEQKNPRNASIQLIEGVPGTGYTDSLLYKGFRSVYQSRQGRREEGVVTARPGEAHV